jgi:ABC-type sugar transport system ATPase subunit
MEEIFELCDRITILRDGQYVGTRNIAETDMTEIVRMMIGREIGERYPKRDVEKGEVIFEVKNLTCPGVFEDVNFSVRAGEVLGVAGLMGAGRTEIMQSIFGNMPHVTGQIFVNGREVHNNAPWDAMKNGIGFITEDRKVEGLMLEETIMKNNSVADEKLDVVASQTANFNRAEGMTVMENMLQANPDIQCVFAHNDEMALGAIEAIGDKEIYVAGFDANDDAIEAVKAGTMVATVAQQPDLMGSTAVETACALMAGEEVEKTLPVEVSLITKDNVE